MTPSDSNTAMSDEQLIEKCDPTWTDHKGRTVIIKSMSDRWLNNIRKKWTGERRKLIKPIIDEIKRRHGKNL